jgi:hypothetical protein
MPFATNQQGPTQADLPRIHALHSELFTDRTYKGNLAERADLSGGFVAERDLGTPFFPTDGTARTLASIVADAACKSNAILRVTVKGGESNLSSNGEWVFTDYVATVDGVVKDNLASPVLVGGSIVIARSGGRFYTRAGHKVEVLDDGYPPLLNGLQYVLFLKSIPSSGQYLSSSPAVDILIDKNGSFKPLLPRLLPGRPSILSPEEFQAYVANAQCGKLEGR